MDIKRRRLLGGLAASALGGGWAGGCAIPSSRGDSKFTSCAPALVIGDPAAPLTIDTHSHVFNGADLQVKQFLTQIVARNGSYSELRGIVSALGSILQFIAWNGAPSGGEELALLRDRRRIFPECTTPQADSQLQAARQSGYEAGRAAVRAARDRAVESRGASPNALARSSSLEDRRLAATHDAIEELLPPSYEEWRDRRDDARSRPGAAMEAMPLRSQETFAGYLDFVLHHFNYRHVNVLDYFETYSPNSARKIDLLVTSLVDFDWWLAQGRPTPTSLREQVTVMERISVLTQGRVHGFISFCPFRETATGDSLPVVKDAIENRGFIGVKLYPPMGFAPYGNCGLDVWRGKNLPAPSQDPKFGCMLDTSMRALFEWCEKNEVPVMAHTNHSNGPSPQFEDLAGAAFWARALERHPKLRASFGHFGDTDSADHDGQRTREFIRLMGGPGAPGENAFADSGFFADALTQEDRLRQTLLALYRDNNTRLIAERFMYGTDWEMLLTQRHVDQYLQRFIRIMRDFDAAGARVRGRSLSDGFFGWNAAAFLGLRRDDAGNRKRLEAFYRKHGVANPDWMKKLDRG